MNAALLAAAEAAHEWALPSPELIRTGMKSVFVAGDEVLRVGTASHCFEADQRFAGVLFGGGVLVPRVLRRLEVGDLNERSVARRR